MSDVVPLEAVSTEDQVVNVRICQANLDKFKAQFAQVMEDFKVEFSVGVDNDNNLRVLINVPSLDGTILATTDLIDPIPISELL